MGCVSSKEAVEAVETPKQSTNKNKEADIRNKTKTNPTIVKNASEHNVQKDGSSLKDDNSMFDLNTSSRTLDTLGLIKVNDDIASTVSLKSFKIDGNVVVSKSKAKELSSLNAVEENAEKIVVESKQSNEESRPTRASSSHSTNTNNSNATPVEVTPEIKEMIDQNIDTNKTKGNVSKPTITITTEDATGDATSISVISRKEKDALNIAPFPSADQQGTVIVANEFEALLHMSCLGMDKSILFENCKNVNTLTLERSMNLYNENYPILYNILQHMTNLSTLNLGALYLGPIAFRTVLLALKFNKSIVHVDISDNMADTECCDLISELLLENSIIKYINLSGNTLGKESLSRSLGRALLKNESLEKIDISSCGVSNVHSICEAIRMNKNTKVVDLNIAHNNLTDPQQFVIDVSLLLEQETCTITNLNITAAGIGSSQMEVLLKAIESNKSLKELRAGQNSVKSSKIIAEFIAIGCCHPALGLLDLNNTIRDESDEENCFVSWSENIPVVSSIQSLHLVNCGINDDLIHKLHPLKDKLKNLQCLDLSANADVTEKGLTELLCIIEEENNPHGFKLVFDMSANADICINSLKAKQLKHLKQLSIKKSKLSEDAVAGFESFSCTIQEINLDGIKLGRSNILKNLLSYECFENLAKLSLSNCVLNDSDLQSVSSNIKRLVPKWPLISLDISVNRLTDAFANEFVDALLVHESHTLQELNLSNNQLKDESLKALIKLFSTSSHKTSLNNLNISNNGLSSNVIKEFVSYLDVKNNFFPLSYADFRAQEGNFTEESMDEVAEELISKLVLSKDDEKMLFEFREIKNKFNMHLTNLGGTAGIKMQVIDSAAIKTDFVKVKKMTGCFADALEIFGAFSSATVTEKPFSITLSLEEWTAIIGQDAPKWLLVNSNLLKCVLVTHMPATVTHQRLEGLFEMEVDCSIKDIFLLKDPIIRKPTGTAWVLFEDEKSVSDAVLWFANGQAQMYGTAFIISRVPVVLSEDAGAEILARKELEARERDLKKERAADRTLLDQSERLAAERAAYREAHPAYQNGRIS